MAPSISAPAGRAAGGARGTVGWAVVLVVALLAAVWAPGHPRAGPSGATPPAVPTRPTILPDARLWVARRQPPLTRLPRPSVAARQPTAPAPASTARPAPRPTATPHDTVEAAGALGPVQAPAATSRPAPPPTPTALPPTAAPRPTPAPGPAWPPVQAPPGGDGHPTLADFWMGRARFNLDVADTGLPMGESDTIVMSNGELWSFLHASAASAGTVDGCGRPVEFPGCAVIYRSYDGGYTFRGDDPPVCLFPCADCPCQADRDHVVQQQYPRVFYDGQTLRLVYEYQGRVMLRRSTDGLRWTAPQRLALTGLWKLWLRDCPPEERIGQHPFLAFDYECLSGGPPGIYVEGGWVYVFLAVGQNPGGMGCYSGSIHSPGGSFQRCAHSPLFVGAAQYGPLGESGPRANRFFDFRTISSAEVMRVGDRYYMLYEGVRGPARAPGGDNQFALGMARSLGAEIDGPWEKYPANPILVDLPGNVGVGHADLVVVGGQTVLYTSLDGRVRSRLVLEWSAGRPPTAPERPAPLTVR